ncbi:neurotrophin 1-like [Portunus trituberculatus]|uniref:Protein spaetzle n=1 Tax=Portunus trituberculatus TaxID=210409 RepID=A0A5B7H1Z3_PORTR|nr:neurotrophin 1-like [Portunus trituberculatus]MPC65102.1 Protein spaetzle [Portunus trituberculatus]
MAARLLVVFLVTATAASEHSSHVVVSVGTEAYGAAPYSYYPQSVYYPQHSYAHQPVYPHHPQPAYAHHEPAVPACAANTTKPWCLEDSEYPLYEIQHALQYNAHHVLDLYADVADLNTALSVERPKTLDEETYLCPSATAYVRPLRAINTEGKWRVIVNNVEVHYQTLTQTARVEECLTAGDACPLVPECYGSTCLQKSIYHRFLVYDPYDYYLPFSIETFALPSSCACLLSAYTLDH